TAKCVVDFYLDWLDKLIDRDDFEGLGIFGHVAAGLFRLADRRSVPYIVDGQRPFPVPQGEDSGWSEPIDPKAFAASIADRLFDLERAERPPKVLPHAIRAFGLTPRTAVEEIALKQQRWRASPRAEILFNSVGLRGDVGKRILIQVQRRISISSELAETQPL